jgi:preprotein translocase subunit YajC
MHFPDIAFAMGADGAGGAGANPIAQFMPLIVMFAIFYFLLIRPQQKKAKLHKQYLQNLKKGDYVLTGGGLYGRIVGVAEEVLTIDLGNDIKVKVNRGFVQGPGDTAAKADAKKDQVEKK